MHSHVWELHAPSPRTRAYALLPLRIMFKFSPINYFILAYLSFVQPIFCFQCTYSSQMYASQETHSYNYNDRLLLDTLLELCPST